MNSKITPAILALLGAGLGLGAGWFLQPAQPEVETASTDQGIPIETTEFVKLNNQFVVPIVEDGRVVSLVILSLSVEVAQGNTEGVYAREPKLRDALLQVMFDHANMGGFNGVFTDGANLVALRQALLEAAKKTLGDAMEDVLISDISRQDA